MPWAVMQCGSASRSGAVCGRQRRCAGGDEASWGPSPAVSSVCEACSDEASRGRTYPHGQVRVTTLGGGKSDILIRAYIPRWAGLRSDGDDAAFLAEREHMGYGEHGKGGEEDGDHE